MGLKTGHDPRHGLVCDADRHWGSLGLQLRNRWLFQGGCSALPLSSMVWEFGGVSFGVVWGCSMAEGVPVTSWRGWVDMVLFVVAVETGDQRGGTGWVTSL